MIQDLIKWLLRIGLQMTIWVFILSLNWGGRTLFDRAHGILVQNPLVDMLSDELALLWHKVALTAQETYAKLRQQQDDQTL